MKVRIASTAIAVLGLCSATMGQGLQKGDTAPKLSVEEFVKGDRFTGFEKGKVYVVEFWATWCGPCIANIPHLAELQEKHGEDGLTVLGVAASERKGRDHLVDWVKNSENGKKMSYTVAYDDDASMWNDWMRAAGRNGIPSAFIVDQDGKIAFIGHPSQMDESLSKVMAKGTTAQADDGKLEVGDRAPELAISEFVKGDPVTGFEKGKVYVVEFWATWCGPCIRGMPHLSELQKQYKDDGVTIIGVNIWDDPANVKPFMKGELRAGQNGDELMGYTVAIEKKHNPEDVRRGKMAEDWMQAAGRNGIPSAFIVDQEGKIAWMGHPATMDGPLREVVTGEKAAEKATVNGYLESLASGKYDQAYKMGWELVKGDGKNDAMMLNTIAWYIVDPNATPEKQDLELAMAAAKRADELTNHENDAILDTLAKVYFDKGDLEKALEIQTKAVEIATPQFREELTNRLEWYKDMKKKRGG